MEKLESADFIRLTWSDLHGMARCRSIPHRHLNKFLADGCPSHASNLAYGLSSEGAFYVGQGPSDTCNMVAMPDISTAHILPWVSNDSFRVAQILCNNKWLSDGQPDMEACSRYILKKQIDNLDKLGFQIKSGFEAEFFVVDAKTQKPIFNRNDYMTSIGLVPYEEFLYEMTKNLFEVGVNVECISTEYSPGQLEFTTCPQIGSKVADDMFLMRQGIKEMCSRKGYIGTFMTKPYKEHLSCGLHYNHSLVDKNGDPVMYDESKPDKLSDVCRWWLGGLLKHSGAMCALCCPTVNDYHRVHSPWAPDKADWAIDDKKVTFRVLNYGANKTYIENRLPGASANPYLVMAANIVAGIDGIINKIEPGKMKEENAKAFPKDLKEALKSFKEDSCFMEAFGPVFYKWFSETKTANEVEKFVFTEDEKERGADFVKEREYYMDFL